MKDQYIVSNRNSSYFSLSGLGIHDPLRAEYLLIYRGFTKEEAKSYLNLLKNEAYRINIFYFKFDNIKTVFWAGAYKYLRDLDFVISEVYEYIKLLEDEVLR